MHAQEVNFESTVGGETELWKTFEGALKLVEWVISQIILIQDKVDWRQIY